MPLATIVTAPGMTWDYVGYYPYPRTDDTIPMGWAGAQGRYMIGTGNVVRENEYRWSNMATINQSLGAGNWQVRCPTGGIPYCSFYGAAAGFQRWGLDAFSAFLDNGTGFALAAGAEFANVQKVHWTRFLIQSPTAAPEPRNGLLITPTNNGVAAWPDNAPGVNNRGGFGITGDGAGQWQYASYNRAGAFGVREVVALPVHVLTDWNMVDIVMIGERVGQAAEVQFWFNGALILTRNWLGALLEPQAANEWRWVPIIEGGSVAAAAFECNIGAICVRKGMYDSQGTAV